MRFAKSYEPGDFEPDIYAAWEAAGMFRPELRSEGRAEGDATFSIVMPPPNANGNLHIGHGLTVAIEDSLTRYYRLRGRASWYIPGADHAGFETWVVYERALEKVGHTRFEYSRDELYQQVWQFVEEQRGNMELQLRALGASCSWDDLTFTLDENVVDRAYTTFEKMWNDGMVYRGEKLVNYCPKHQTAFADIEVEHKDEDGKLWDIAYQLVDAPMSSAAASSRTDDDDNNSGITEIIVSTTRPETLFGDAAVAVNPEDKRYKELIGQMVKLPLTKREIPIIADEHADPEYGTGAVKITPAHDFDDFEVGERHDLPRIVVIGEDGLMTEEAGADYAGLTTEECRKKVLKNLKEQGLLKGEKKITHAVAHCYKCGTVIEPMLKDQWFIDVERLAKGAIERLENNEIQFFPANKKKVLINYLKGLKDWNISRQIPWGIAIPMFRKAAVQTSGIAEMSSADELSEKDHSELSFAEKEVREAPEWIFDKRTNLTEIEVGGVKYVRDEDTFDTWFSSAHWPIVCTDWVEGKDNPFYPLNVMETGADILFAWVARMIMMGVYVTGEVPFKQVYLHGLVLDAKGQKMSKSKGNVLNPVELVAQYGSDAFRMGILRGRSAGMNQAFSENSVVSGRNLCNKLWNIARLVEEMVDRDTSRILSGESSEISSSAPRSSRPSLRGSAANTRQQAPCCADVDISSDITRDMNLKRTESNDYTTDNMGEDWICRELNSCREQIESDFENYRFAEAVETIHSVIWDKYADWFLESQKLYQNAPLLMKTLEMLLIIAHPFAPFVTETIWQNLSWTEGMIIDQKWPSRLKFDPLSASEFERLMVVVSEARGTLQSLPSGKKWDILYGDDSIVEENAELVKLLTKVPAVKSCEGAPRGMRLPIANHEVYLDVPEEIVKKYRTSLEERIMEVGRELDALNKRMMNPSYVDKAPAHLVRETEQGIKEKTELIERLKQELNVI